MAVHIPWHSTVNIKSECTGYSFGSVVKFIVASYDGIQKSMSKCIFAIYGG